jgi:hypothetical protein
MFIASVRDLAAAGDGSASSLRPPLASAEHLDGLFIGFACPAQCRVPVAELVRSLRRAWVELSEGFFSPQMHADGRRFFSRVWRVDSMRSHPGRVTGRHSVLAESKGPEIFGVMNFGMPNQALERTGLSRWVSPWGFWFAHISSPVAELGSLVVTSYERSQT